MPAIPHPEQFHPNERRAITDWLRSVAGYPDGELILFNFYEEDRIPTGIQQRFLSKTLALYTTRTDGVAAYREAIRSEGLFMLVASIGAGIPQSVMHVTTLRYLVERDYLEVDLKDKPPSQIALRKPLGFGKPMIWASFGERVESAGQDAVRLRDLLGLPTIEGDHLYVFPFNLDGLDKFVPTSFDAMARPPFRPVGNGTPWGLTRSLLDDSPGAPEIVLPSRDGIARAPTGYLVRPTVDLSPSSWKAVRQHAASNDLRYQTWRTQWLL